MNQLKHIIFKTLVKLWNIYPFKLMFRGLINKRPTWKTKVYKDFRFKGVMKVQLNERTFKLYNPGYTTIENEIFWNNLEGWEKISIQIWNKLAESSNVILDIGANTGVYSLIATTVNPNAKVFAFEPVRRTYELTKKNIDINNAQNVTLLTKAVSNRNGIATFFDVPSSSQYSASLNEKMLQNIQNRVQYDVETIRIDSIPELKDIKIDLIKLDVEMHEPEALEGMLEMIKRDKPSILIEILNEEIAQRVNELVKEIGYLYFSIDEENKPVKLNEIHKSSMYNLLMIREDLLPLIQDQITD